jgi:glycosyltransferase involved in cell wall biosynthesis
MKTITIVIPVYNEAAQIGDCLLALSRLKPQPLEVIVVDNNSIDETVNIVSQFSFVKLLSEPRQGVVHARNRGFNAAQGDIIGRIDADSRLPTDWVAKVETVLSDKSIAAVSGSAHYYDFGLYSVADKIDGFCRRYLARRLQKYIYLWGANMAITKPAWQAVRGSLCSRSGLHEDFDLAIHLQEFGLKVVYDEIIHAGVSSRRIDTGLADYIRYTLRSSETYAAHGLDCQRYMYPVIALCWLAYLPGRLVYRGYDNQSNNFSLGQLLTGSPGRVDPTANVIS